MALFNSAKAQAAADNLVVINLKKGKSEDQCKCIDFFYLPDEPAKKGCLGGKSSAWTIDDYCAHVDRIVNGLNLKARAIAKIGLDESQISEIAPICLTTFLRGENIRRKYNADYTKFVSNQFSVTWIFFSATQLYTHTYIFDTMSDNSWEYTRDFFYSDITCIRTEHEVEEVIHENVSTKGCGCTKKAEAKYTHHNIHWDTLQITVPNDSYSFCCRTHDVEGIEQSIQAAKAMIREKKQA